jgi:hypothetical protein
MIVSCFFVMANEKDSARGRSATGSPAVKRKSSSSRRFHFKRSNPDSCSSAETDSIDFASHLFLDPLLIAEQTPTCQATSAHFTPLSLPPPTPHLTIEDIFLALHRMDSYIPHTPKLVSAKERAFAHLRKARLDLLHQLKPTHQLLSRLKLNGGLKPIAGWVTASLPDAVPRKVQPKRAKSAYLKRRDEQRSSNLALEILPEDLRGNAEQRLVELLTRKRPTWNSQDPYVVRAKKEEASRRKALEEELDRVNAQIEQDAQGLITVYHECAKLSEFEAEMMFPIEIAVAA